MEDIDGEGGATTKQMNWNNKVNKGKQEEENVKLYNVSGNYRLKLQLELKKFVQNRFQFVLFEFVQLV